MSKSGDKLIKVLERHELKSLRYTQDNTHRADVSRQHKPTWTYRRVDCFLLNTGTWRLQSGFLPTSYDVI